MKLLTVALLSALGMAGCGSDDDDPITTVRSAAPSFSAAWPALDTASAAGFQHSQALRQTLLRNLCPGVRAAAGRAAAV